MFTFEYRFYPKQFSRDFLDDFENDMNWFIASLSKNGMVLENYQNTSRFETYYACRLITPTLNSLNETYYNKYNSDFLADLITKSSRPPEFEFVAENNDVENSCSCEKPSHYVLFTSHSSSVSPIICGDCLQPVPLHNFPKTYDDNEYYDVLNWQKVYKGCDIQFMQGIGEKHGYYMIHNPKSSLTVEGLRICNYLEAKMRKKFYYFLYDYYSKNKPTCPKCGENWVNQSIKEVRYDFVCEKCRFVSK